MAGWKYALEVAQAANNEEYLGYNDWRLPNMKELESLFDSACYLPAINETVFPNTKSDLYWSSSPRASNDDGAWSVNFNYGNVGYYGKGYGSYVRLVRGGQ